MSFCFPEHWKCGKSDTIVALYLVKEADEMLEKALPVLENDGDNTKTDKQPDSDSQVTSSFCGDVKAETKSFLRHGAQRVAFMSWNFNKFIFVYYEK